VRILDAGELIEEMGSEESNAFQSTFYTVNTCCNRTAPPPLSMFFFRSDNRCQYTAVWPVVWSMLVAVNVIEFMLHYVNSPSHKRTRLNHVTHHNGHSKSGGYPIRSFSLDAVIEHYWLAYAQKHACLCILLMSQSVRSLTSLELMYNVSC
jgi:hypothetical protein